QHRERMRRERADSLGHRAAPLARLGEPVAQARREVRAVDAVEADRADDRSVVEDRGLEAVVLGELALRAAEELALLLGADAARRPRHPLGEVRAVGRGE